ncbi:ATP-binding protein [Nocardiopsis sp. EMB25]|uniref:ATP-binding protein n=1 Tax=Nocardiopsis TaxID=2013 RepID=UPI000349BC31|nr:MULTISPECIES: ATP-binding protein [Nocardiopsis]MCY9783616.1 ATP-binding protein [Nocardiopsis sp. EMB25]
MPTVASTVVAPGISVPPTGDLPLVGDTTDLPAHLSCRLPHTPCAAGRARRSVEDFLRERGGDVLGDAAHLIVSELVTNAVRHGRPPVDLTLTWLDGHTHRPRLRVEVLDRGTSGCPALSTGFGDDRAEGGRGLMLVEACSDRWGASPHTDAGLRVWAEIAGPETGD